MRTILGLLIVVLVAGMALAQDATLMSYDVALVKLTEPVTVDGAAFEQAYLVRLHGSFPMEGARLFRVRIGEEELGQLGGFPGGVYFFVYGDARLQKLAGGEIRSALDAAKPQSLGTKFEPGKFGPFTVLSEREALTR
jgi:hypothetical protein